MKKALVYTFAAVLLGTITMLAPFAFFAAEKDTTKMDAQAKGLSPFTQEFMRKAPEETEKAFGITPANYPVDAFFVLVTLTLSLVVALAVKRYFMKKPLI
jgi:hypothetical protein